MQASMRLFDRHMQQQQRLLAQMQDRLLPSERALLPAIDNDEAFITRAARHGDDAHRAPPATATAAATAAATTASVAKTPPDAQLGAGNGVGGGIRSIPAEASTEASAEGSAEGSGVIIAMSV